MFVDYDKFAKQYGSFRTSDKRIANKIFKHLEGAKKVINVGAGTGAYEPIDCDVVAIEPSHEMTTKRKSATATVIQGYAEDLPFDDNEFEMGRKIAAYTTENQLIDWDVSGTVPKGQILKTKVLGVEGGTARVHISYTFGSLRYSSHTYPGSFIFFLEWTDDELVFVGHEKASS